MSSKILPQSFYLKDCIVVGKNLLGKILIHHTKNGPIGGIITETESYLNNDPASHSFKGPNLRNKVMFEKGGVIYIYQIYGIHHCLNVVTGPSSLGEAVLIRSLEPTIGIDLMKQNRKTDNSSKARISRSSYYLLTRSSYNLLNLTNGPAKLVQALDISANLNGSNLISGPIKIYSINQKIPESNIIIGKRIGITKATNELMRFYIKNNPYVSKS